MLKRRGFLSGAALAAGYGSLGLVAGRAAQAGAAAIDIRRAAADPAFRIRNGRLKQTVMGWCFKPMEVMDLARHCAEIGMKGMEGIDAKYYPEVRKLGLEISLVSGHSFAQGPCNPEFREEVLTKLRSGIELAAQVGCKKVITFTGMRYDGMDEGEAADRCVEVWKEVLPLAEERGVTLVLEHLNSRDGSHPMKGHPGYFGDDVDFCVELVKRVGSPNFKLLFDIYHVTIMNGDVIRRIQQHHEFIGHYHTAGNPGRCELDEHQEIHYPPILEAIVATGYNDFIAQEFIPTWEDPVLALRHACMVCDI